MSLDSDPPADRRSARRARVRRSAAVLGVAARRPGW